MIDQPHATATTSHSQLAYRRALWHDRSNTNPQGRPDGESTLMVQARDVMEVLNRDFLETRSRVLEVAAALNRLDRAVGHRGDPPDRRLAQLQQAIEALLEPGPGRDGPADLLARLHRRLAEDVRAGSPGLRC